MKTMIAHAFAESINLAVTALAFWYGGKLLSEGLYDTRTFFIVFMAVLTGSNSGGILFGYSSSKWTRFRYRFGHSKRTR
jgi:ATP-binding cassette subfamily B (MDR/TAP) protein 1